MYVYVRLQIWYGMSRIIQIIEFIRFVGFYNMMVTAYAGKVCVLVRIRILNTHKTVRSLPQASSKYSWDLQQPYCNTKALRIAVRPSRLWELRVSHAYKAYTFPYNTLTLYVIVNIKSNQSTFPYVYT